MAKQIGYAVVGAGPLVERALLPAFARAGGETRLAAIVSADGARDESTAALIRFPDDRLAHLHTSFGEEPTSILTLFGAEGSIQLTGAYETFEPADVFATELAYFSNCVLRDVAPEPSGIDGLTNVRIVEAIYRSARDGRPVTLPRIARVEASPAEHDVLKPVADRRQAS
jgi:glucose-fructose oxidoreductase